MIPVDLKGWEEVTGCESSTYRVGVLATLYWCRMAIRHRGQRELRGEWPAHRIVATRLSVTTHHLATAIRRREWRAVRNQFNGWLCELDEPTGGVGYATKCGRGWTQRRAQRSLVRHLIERAQEMNR